ncbi:MAG TPA: hypothetical protein VGC47_15310 [Acidimicrobiia bacterium]|jgi:hypothetical protein
MDTTHEAASHRQAADHSGAADELLARLAQVDAADAPAVADELAEALLITLDLREDAPEAVG